MAYQWSPDYSSFINADQYPGATWHAADYGGGSEGAAPTAAGWYSPGGWVDGGSEGGGYMSNGTRLDSEVSPNYWSLKDAGLWNLTDFNSDTWKFLQSAGGGGDVKTDPNALARALMYGGQLGQAAFSRDEQGRAQVEGAYKEALNGLNPEFVDKFSNAIGGATEGYWTASKQHEDQGVLKDMDDNSHTFADLFTQTPLGVALIAATGGAAAGAMGGAAEGGAAAGTIAGGTEASAGLGSMIGSGLNSMAAPLVDMGLTQGTANATLLGGLGGAGKTALTGGDFGDVLKGGALGAVGGGVGSTLFGGGGVAGAPLGPDGFPMGGSFGGTFEGTPSGVWGGDDGGFSGDFTTNPSLEDLGGVIDPSTGFPSMGGTSNGMQMPSATPESDPTFGGQLQQTSPGVFQQPPLSDLSSMLGNGSPEMPAATPEEDPTFGGELQELGPGVFSQGASGGLTPEGGAPSQLGEPTGTQLDAGIQPSGAETFPLGSPEASSGLPGLQDQLSSGGGFDLGNSDLQSQLSGNLGVTGNPTQGGNMDDFDMGGDFDFGDDFGGDFDFGGMDDLSGFDDIFGDDEDFGNLFGDDAGDDDLFDGFESGDEDFGFGDNDEDLFDGFDAGEDGSGLNGLKNLLKKGFGGLGSALGKVPLGGLASGVLAAKTSQKNMQALKDMQQKAIDSDLWRPQQSRYFEPAYDAATKGIGNTPYGQSIASDTNRNMAAQGYNMSGNQMHEVAQGLNRGSMDYLKAVGPLATGRAPAGDGSGYASGVSGAYNLFNQGAQAGLGSIINGTGGSTGTSPGPTLGDLAGGIKNSLSL